jgi:hypothetical protein
MKIYLFLLSAIGLAGELAKAGSIVEADEELAKNLLRRGKARVATKDELRAAGHEVPDDEDEAPPVPTREQLDAALQNDLAGQTDPDYVVRAMRAHFGALFTDADEARVRDAVKPAGAGAGSNATLRTGKASDGLTVGQLKAALDAAGIAYPADAKKPALAALLDEAPAA